MKSKKWIGLLATLLAFGACEKAYEAPIEPETKQEVVAANFKMRSRTFDVFYGPITDNMGNLRVEAGESMSDSEMLNGFDWCVEGVTVEE